MWLLHQPQGCGALALGGHKYFDPGLQACGIQAVPLLLHQRCKALLSPAYLLLDYIARYGRQSGMESQRPPESLTVNRTRQLLQEEIGVNVKTLNRTIRQLKEEGFFTICKGKLSFTREQYLRAIEWLEAAKDK